jgi:DNA polymerase-1
MRFTIEAETGTLGCTFVQTADELAQWTAWMAGQAGVLLGLDCETNAHDAWDPQFRLRLIQISDGRQAWLLPEPFPADVAGVIRAHPRFVAHFSENEIKFLSRGLPGSVRLGDLDPHIIDCQVVQAIAEPRTLAQMKDGIDPRLRLEKGLKASVAREFGPALQKAEGVLTDRFRELAPVGSRTPKAAKTWGFRNVPIDDPAYLAYGALDAWGVKVLHDTYEARLTGAQVAEYGREITHQWDIDNMTYRGMPVDPGYVRWLADQLETVTADNTLALMARGIGPSGMGPKVGVALVEAGAEPRDSYDKDALRDIVAAGAPQAAVELAQRVQAVRRAGKFRSAYVGPMLAAAQRDGRLHPSFRSLGTVTGRNSAADPPVQQLPKKDTRVRAAVTAPDGWTIVSADLAQGEPRVMAGLSGDPNLIAALASGDLNSAIAQLTYGEEYSPAEGKQEGTASYLLRQRAKAGLLATCYGAGVRKLAATLGVPVAEGQKILDRWRAAYGEMFARFDRINRQAYAVLPSGRHVTLWDRKTVLPDGRVITRAKPSRNGGNVETQGHQADILKAAWRRLRDRWAWALMMFVHDEIVLLVPERMAQQAVADLVEAMTMPIGHGVLMLAEGTINGRTWTRRPSDFDERELAAVDE